MRLQAIDITLRDFEAGIERVWCISHCGACVVDVSERCWRIEINEYHINYVIGETDTEWFYWLLSGGGGIIIKGVCDYMRSRKIFRLWCFLKPPSTSLHQGAHQYFHNVSRLANKYHNDAHNHCKHEKYTIDTLAIMRTNKCTLWFFQSTFLLTTQSVTVLSCCIR